LLVGACAEEHKIALADSIIVHLRVVLLLADREVGVVVVRAEVHQVA